MHLRKTNKLDDILILNAIIFPEDDLDVSKKTFHWIAKEGSMPIGFCSAKDIGYRILYLTRAGVLKEHRGNGIQKRFIKARERFAKRNNFKKIITYTLKDNYQSIASLIKSGYLLYKPEYDYAGPEFVYLIKEL